MTKLRAALLPCLACVLGCASPGSLQAAAISYRFVDFGRTDNTPGLPDTNYPYPQVDQSGVVSTARGITDAGSYHVSTENYTSPGGESQSATYSVAGGNLVRMFVTSNDDQYSFATGVNAAGAAIGVVDPGVGGINRIHSAFIYNPGGPSMTPGQLPGFSFIPGATAGSVAWYAFGINSGGMIVGQMAPPVVLPGIDFYQGHAMISDGKTSTDLNTLIGPNTGFMLTAATSINDRGQIAGYAYDLKDGTNHIFLLDPIATPEPGTFSFAVVSACIIGARRLIGRRAENNSRIGA